MSNFNYSFELFDFEEAITPYGTLDTVPPTQTNFIIDNFEPGEHFRTGPEVGTNHLELQLEDRLLTLIVDESGSMTWNDNNADRFSYYKRLLTKLEATYPGTVQTNLIGFGGVLTNTNLFLAEAGTDFLTSEGLSFTQFLQQTFQDSVFDFAGVRVVRRTDRFPEHPSDGVVVAEGIFEAVKDENLEEGQTYYYGVWTFNKNRHFSVGQFVKSVPRDRILPQGVNFASIVPRILPGVERDVNTQLIYSFLEGNGNITFDSSGNSRHGTIGSEVIEEVFWSGDAASVSYDDQGDLKKPAGVRFDGQFDIIESDIDSNLEFVGSSGSARPLTINFWIFRYESDDERWILGTSEDIPSNSVGWAVSVSRLGNIRLYLDEDVSDDTPTVEFLSDVIPAKEWKMVTLSLRGDSVDLYIDGQLKNTNTSIAIENKDTSGRSKLYIGAKLEDSDSTWQGKDYFGALNQISIHNTERSASYIENLYNQELKIFNQPIRTTNTSPPDNTQREVLISWNISSDYNYEGGDVRLIRKYKDIPSHVDDGDLLTIVNASPGQFYFMDSFEFINNGDYYYRLFTKNSLGNFCERAEARILPVHIPYVLGTTVPPLDPVSEETITAGNKKLLLQWTNPGDTRWKGTKVFFGLERFPTISIASQGTWQVTDGELIEDTVNSSFVHRTIGSSCSGSDIPLVNGRAHYYTLVTYDRLGNISETKNLFGVPSVSSTEVFLPEEVEDVFPTILNRKTLSIRWKNPTIRSSRLDLYFGDTALAFVSVKDLFGGNLDDITNLQLQVCTEFETRSIETNGQPLDNGGGLGDLNDGFNPRIPCTEGGEVVAGRFGAEKFNENCNSDQEAAETVLTYAGVESGLVKGVVAHTNNRDILSRRKKYTMDIRAQYKVEDPDADSDDSLFTFNTEPVTVTFTHPIKMTAINKLNKSILVGCDDQGDVRVEGRIPCDCREILDEPNCEPKPFSGGYTNATIPYVVRVEVQYKGEALPDGTPVNVQLFKHGDGNNPHPLNERSDRTFIREGQYSTSAVLEEELDFEGRPTGNVISKSIVDIEVPHPSLPDHVDVYVTLDYLGFFFDIVHDIRFISTLFLRLDVTKPEEDGIDVAEQFASVWTLDPDNPTETLPVPDGTLIKWELQKLRFGKDRPFYSTERLPALISGVYSRTTSGVARNVFFGPIGDIEKHFQNLVCNDEGGAPVAAERCCIGEEYSITASVILDEESAKDTVKFAYGCGEDESFTNKRFFMNAARSQPGSNPHWVTWADGESLLKFQIAKNPAITTDDQMLGASCFRACVDAIGNGQLFAFPEEQIIQISAPSEILWDVTFEEDPYTGKLTPIQFDSISPSIAEDLGIPFVANIPVRGEVTDFYCRLNAFIGDGGNPKPEECSGGGGGGGTGGGSDSADPCEWVNICDGISICNPTSGRRWVNVGVVSGITTLIANNRSVSLQGGGDYKEGVPPIYLGFKEPLDVRVIDARINGERVEELVVDSASQHTFVVEVTFAGEVVPDGTAVEVTIEGQDEDIVNLSNCVNAPAGCFPSSTGTIYTRLVNDPIVNPSGDKRSLAYFTISPLPDVAFNSRINVTCRYDKLGTVEREITRCIELSNTVNEEPPVEPPGSENTPIQEAATSNESIVYDSTRNLYETVPAGQIRRMGHFAAATTTGTADALYILGGYTGSGESSTSNITPSTEIFNTTTQEWDFSTDMPTARAYGMTVEHDSKIYCIGGIELDSLLSQHIVSRKIEVFDTATELWNNTLTPMPEDNGVAYGDAQVIGDSIYVTCGITSLVDNSKPGDLNTKVLKYSISNDTWTTITPSNSNLYQRLAPFGFYRSNPKNVGQSDLIESSKAIYIYGGSVPKSPSEIEAERNARVNELLDEFRSFLLTSAYFLNLTPSEQQQFIEEKEEEIRNGVVVPAFIYPTTGFKLIPETETTLGNDTVIDISDTLDDEWPVLPIPRDHGQAVYIPNQDIAYFIGGSNQNKSTTLNKNESIDLQNGNNYISNTALSRGRAMFKATAINDDIYLTGGLTSGHAEGWIEVDIQQIPEFVEALGVQSGGLLITLKNDSGEVINEDVRVDIRGRLRLPEIDNILAEFQANRGADRALGGDGSGNAPDLPEEGDSLDEDRLNDAQNSIVDPNSDQFQFNAARRLNEEVSLFPILYSSNEIILEGGIGGVTLLPRSEDPLADFQKLSQFVQTLIDNTPPDTDERFEGNLTREELAALGDVLNTVTLPPTVIDSGALRELYDIETVVTILDTFFFGQTVSDFDENVQDQIESRIKELLTPPEPEDDGGGSGQDDTQGGVGLGGGSSAESECFVLQHSAQPDIPGPDSPPGSGNPNNPSGTGGFSQSGQCLFCETILPLNVSIRNQLSTPLTTFYNSTDWLPQIKKRLIDGDHTISETLEVLDTIDSEIPFGSSQLYNALFEAARTSSSDTFDNLKKVIYVASDNSQNLSLVTRSGAIEEVNSIDGDRKTPVVYTVFSTSFPVSITALLERAETGDVVKISEETGGQSISLISSGFLDQILNLALGGATGGLGYGIYKRTIDLGELSAITGMTLNFALPSNTQGFVRFRYSEKGYEYTDFTERFEGNSFIDLIDFFARYIEFEVVLTTGFTADITEEYDEIQTGIPKLTSINLVVSGEREDFIFVDSEDVLTNVQQAAMAFEGTIPKSSIVELGVATSNSHNWSDFQSPARPAVNEFGKTFLIERDKDAESIVGTEPLTTEDGILYTATYGPFDPDAEVRVFYNDGDADLELLSGFKLFPREGQVYFDTRQPPTRVIKMTIVNDNVMRMGVRLRNRLHTEAITVEGVGYIYSTNDAKPTDLAQIPPRAVNVQISPPNPTSADTIFALYDYIDFNNDTETGTIISWFKNGTQLFEIQNRDQFVNNNLLLSNRLEPGDSLQFTVTPSDGKDFGTTVFSSNVTIQAQQPNANDVRIVPFRDGVINNRFDTASVFTAEYTFQTDDTGVGALENGTLIQWFVNGQLFKEATFTVGEEDPYSDPKTLIPTDLSAGQTAHVIGNQIYVEITPKTLTITGEKIRSQTITVENSLPIASNVQIEPLLPNTQSTLLLSFDISDPDITIGTQTDQTEIKWFSSSNGTDFAEITDLEGETSVPPFFLRSGESWYATITPFDGLDLGPSVNSNTVTIQA